MSIDLTPGSPEWTKRITASKVAAILGVSPWQSPFSLWQEMKGNVERPAQSEVQSRGHYLEPAILAWWRDQRPAVLFMEQPTYTLGEWAAATPDAVTQDLAGVDALVEAKSAAYDDDWGDPGTDQIPAYYLVQCQWQMHVSGVHRCYVPIITSRLRFVEYVVDYDAESGPLLEARMREFYDSLSADTPPPLDDSVATFQTMRRLHAEIDPKASVELTWDQSVMLLEAITDRESCEARERLHRSQVLEAMGRAQYAEHNGVKVARRQPNKSGVSFVPLTKSLPLLEEMERSA